MSKWVYFIFYCIQKCKKKPHKTEEAVHIYADGVVTDKVGILT